MTSRSASTEPNGRPVQRSPERSSWLSASCVLSLMPRADAACHCRARRTMRDSRSQQGPGNEIVATLQSHRRVDSCGRRRRAGRGDSAAERRQGREGQGPDKKPKLTLKAQPVISMAPSQVDARAPSWSAAPTTTRSTTARRSNGMGRRHAIGVDRRLRAVRSGKERDQAALTRRACLPRRLLQVAFRLKRRDKTVGLGDHDDSGSGRRRFRTVTISRLIHHQGHEGHAGVKSS